MKVIIPSDSRVAELSLLRPDAQNVREKINEKDPAFVALVASIKRDGIIEPLVVREDGLIVCGHRRHAAAVAAKLTEAPVVVRNVPDEDLRAFRIVENLHRQDLSPMEESDAFAALKKDGVSEEEICERATVSIATVRRRLKLQELPAKVKKALRGGEISTMIATSIATIPDKSSQAKALDEALERDYNGDRMRDREFLAHVRSNYMTALKDAPFDIKDPELVKKAGACTECPFNSACDAVLFPSLTEETDGVCSKQSCFIEKRNAHVVNAMAEYEKKGVKVYNPEDAEDLKKLDKWFSYRRLSHSAPWVETKNVPWGQPKNGKKTLKTLVGKHLEMVVLIEPLDRVPIEVYDARKAAAAVRENCAWAKPKKGETSSSSLGFGGAAAVSEEEKKRKQQQRDADKAKREGENNIVERIKAIGDDKLTLNSDSSVRATLMQMLIEEMMNDDTAKAVIRYFEIPCEKEDYKPRVASAFVRGMSENGTIKFAIACMVARLYNRPRWDAAPEDESPIERLLEVIGVDHKECVALAVADVEVAVREREEREAAKKKKAAAKEKAATTKKAPVKKKPVLKKPIRKKPARKEK